MENCGLSNGLYEWREYCSVYATPLARPFSLDRQARTVGVDVTEGDEFGKGWAAKRKGEQLRAGGNEYSSWEKMLL